LAGEGEGPRMSQLISRWSKSRENLHEKKKWNIINIKAKKKKNLSKAVISEPVNYKHTAGANTDGKSFFSDDQSSLPAVKTAEIITRSKVPPEPETFDLFADIQAKIGSMNILEDVLSIMDRQCPRAAVSTISDDDFSSRQFSDVVESDHIDRNSLAFDSQFIGNTTDYTSDTESRGTGYSSTSVDESEVDKSDAFFQNRRNKIEVASQKDSFYSTTDVSQCETDREVQL